MHIRPAQLADCPAIIPLGKNLLELHGDFDPNYYLLESNFDQLFGLWVNDQIGKQTQFLFVAETDEKEIVGFISGFLKSLYPWFQTKIVGHIGYMYVTARYRKMGVGKSLESEADLWFKSKNVSYIELYVEDANSIGQAAWVSYGFAPFKKFLQKKIQI